MFSFGKLFCDFHIISPLAAVSCIVSFHLYHPNSPFHQPSITSSSKLPISPTVHYISVQTSHLTNRPLHQRPNSPFHQPSITSSSKLPISPTVHYIIVQTSHFTNRPLHHCPAVMMDSVVRCLCIASSSLVTAGKDSGGCGGGMVPHAGHHESHELSSEFRCLPPHTSTHSHSTPSH